VSRWWVALGLVALVPSVHASIPSSDVYTLVDFAHLRVDYDGVLEGQAALQVRHAIDRFTGNDDGNVSTKEVQQFEVSYREFLNQNGVDSDLTGNVTMDAAPPETFYLASLNLHGAEGKTNSNARIGLQGSYWMNWTGEPGVVRTLRIQVVAEPRSAYNGTESVTAPNGFKVSKVTGAPGSASFGPDRRSVTYAQPGWQATNLTVTFEKGPAPSRTTSTPPLSHGPPDGVNGAGVNSRAASGFHPKERMPAPPLWSLAGAAALVLGWRRTRS